MIPTVRRTIQMNDELWMSDLSWYYKQFVKMEKANNETAQ